MVYKAKNSVIELFDDYSSGYPKQNSKQLREQDLKY